MKRQVTSCICCLAEQVSGRPNLQVAEVVRNWGMLCQRHRDIALRQQPPHPEGAIEWDAGEVWHWGYRL